MTTTSTARSTNHHTGAVLDDAVKDIKDTASRNTRDVLDAAAQDSERLGEIARAWLKRSSDMANTAASAVRDETQALNDKTQRYVREEPVKSILIAAAAGAALAGLFLLLRQRRD